MGSMSAAPIDRKVRGVLSPSRAGDFMSCPLLFRYRTIDRLPEGSSPDAVRGTLVHQVLEEIFDLPAAERTPAAAHRLLEPAWRQLQQRVPTGPRGRRHPRRAGLARRRRTPCSTAGSSWRTRPGWSRPTARSSSRPRSTRGCRCAASSTGSTRAPDGALQSGGLQGTGRSTPPFPRPPAGPPWVRCSVGDLLLGRDGKPTKVTRKSGVHHRLCYRVTFRDGTSVVCDNVHLWKRRPHPSAGSHEGDDEHRCPRSTSMTNSD